MHTYLQCGSLEVLSSGTQICTQMESPLPRKRLERNLASRQDRLH